MVQTIEVFFPSLQRQALFEALTEAKNDVSSFSVMEVVMKDLKTLHVPTHAQQVAISSVNMHPRVPAFFISFFCFFYSFFIVILLRFIIIVSFSLVHRCHHQLHHHHHLHHHQLHLHHHLHHHHHHHHHLHHYNLLQDFFTKDKPQKVLEALTDFTKVNKLLILMFISTCHNPPIQRHLALFSRHPDLLQKVGLTLNFFE